MVWLAFALIAAVTVAAIIRPLLKQDEAALPAHEADLAVYRDQLAEIDAEREQGLMGAAEAEAARAELARRIIARAEREKNSAQQTTRMFKVPRVAVQACAVAIPAVAIGLYALVGAPSMPDRPFAARAKLPDKQAPITELVAKVEARLAESPDDAAGWDVLAPVYLMQRRYGEALEAFRKSIKLSGESPKRLAGLAEASLATNNGIVSEEARRAFERIVELDPKRAEARFWLAIAKEQDGKLAAAAADLEALIKDGNLDETARKATEERLGEIRGRLGPRTAAQAPANAAPSAAGGPGPGQPDASAVAGMSEAERAQFIDRMVAGLAERLKKDGKDVQGWVKLIRAYKTLGRDKDALTALDDARKALAGDASGLAQIDDTAKSLKLGS